MPDVTKEIIRLDVSSKTGIPIRVLHIPPHIRSLYHYESSPWGLVEFYDSRYNHTPDGQFIASYTVTALFGCYLEKTGLDLYMGIEDWILDPRTTRKVLNWIPDIKRG